MVFVLNRNGKQLKMCHNAKARKLLKEGKAVVHKVYPFTIRLKELKFKEGPETKTYRLKIDPGSKTTGLSILNDGQVVWLAELSHRTNIKQKLEKRSKFRRSRRSRKTRYRKKKFSYRTRSESWVAPSIESKINNVETWVNRLSKICPIGLISYEITNFDTQKMQNPDIEGIEYQQGELMGYEVREYLLEKFGRKCAYCGKENVPLQMEHVIARARGGSNRISNLTIACNDCNKDKGDFTPDEYIKHLATSRKAIDKVRLENFKRVLKQLKTPLKDAAFMNIMKKNLYKRLCSTGLPIECGTGARTKMQRIKRNLPKEHYIDACCVGESTPENLYFKTNEVLKITAGGRGSYCRTRVNASGFPVGYLARQKMFFGFQSGDIISANVPNGKYKGSYTGAVATRKTGRFDIRNSEGKNIAQGINYKYCALIQRYDGYKYFNGIANFK